jgi:mannose-6-phosphate isomerase-like protein (cupin superfamily)
MNRRELLTGMAGLAFVGRAEARETAPNAVELVQQHFNARYAHPSFGRAEHVAYHRYLQDQYALAERPGLKRWNSTPEKVYVNEAAGESITILGVSEQGAEMLWVLAPAYADDRGRKVVAHVPFEHRHSNQAEVFCGLEGSLRASLNGKLFEFSGRDTFTAQAEDDHVAWNVGAQPLAMHVRYAPSFGQDGERALMTYWGYVNDPRRVTNAGAPRDFLEMAALNHHLGPQASVSNMPAWIPRLARPLITATARSPRVRALYKELTGEDSPC